MIETACITHRSDGGRARVLVEAVEWSERALIARALEEAGYAVVTCSTPAESTRECLLVGGCGCVHAYDADVVVHKLSPADPASAEALRALRRRLPYTPVVVEAPESVIDHRPEEYRGCTLVAAPMTRAALVEAVDRVVAVGHAPG